MAAWLAEFGGRPLAEPHRIQWQAPSSLAMQSDLAEDEVPQGGSLLEAIAETVDPADTDDASDLGGQSATSRAAPTGAPEVEAPSTGAASTAVAAAVPSPRPSPEAEPGLVSGRQAGIAGATAADPAAADPEREADAADGRAASTTEANPTSRGQASEPKPTETAGDATGPITRSSGA